MLEFIDSPDDVLALKIRGRITGADLDAIMDRLEPALERADKLHVFVETVSIDAIALDGLAQYAGRALPLFGKLNRFGRVAVVADQAWIRFGSRVESAVLPFITYRVFEPQERERALAWVLTGEDAGDA
jgi:hypothetical protein